MRGQNVPDGTWRAPRYRRNPVHGTHRYLAGAAQWPGFLPARSRYFGAATAQLAIPRARNELAGPFPYGTRCTSVDIGGRFLASTSQAMCEQFARRRHSIRADGADGSRQSERASADAAGSVTDASHMSSRTAPSQLLGPRARDWIQRWPGSYESAARLRYPFNHYELALAAPREEIGREIRGVAVPFPQVGFFLWRVGIRLHHFPV